jgi:hypothetical protein
MKVVINECYGGFGLSSKAMSRIAELQGRECYTFDLKTEPTSDGYKSSYVPVDPNSERAYYYFDIPNPNEVIKNDKTWSKHQYDLHSIENFDKDRSNPLLIRVVEELGPSFIIFNYFIGIRNIKIIIGSLRIRINRNV